MDVAPFFVRDAPLSQNKDLRKAERRAQKQRSRRPPPTASRLPLETSPRMYRPSHPRSAGADLSWVKAEGLENFDILTNFMCCIVFVRKDAR